MVPLQVTILVHNGSSCASCGDGKSIDHKATGAKAMQCRKRLQLTQKEVAKRMGIAQSYYAALEAGQRNWVPALAQSFVNALYEENQNEHRNH